MGKGEEGVTLKSFIFLADSGRSAERVEVNSGYFEGFGSL